MQCQAWSVGNPAPPVGDARQGDVEQVVRVQHVVHGLIDVREAEGAVQLALPDLAVVVVQGLQVLVHLQRLAHQPQVERACSASQICQPRND